MSWSVWVSSNLQLANTSMEYNPLYDNGDGFSSILLPLCAGDFSPALLTDPDNKMKQQVRTVANDEIWDLQSCLITNLPSVISPVNMCKYMGIQPDGTDTYLRYMLRKRLQWIKNDDKMIQSKGGVDARSEDELREDCRERGMLGLLEEMRQQLSDWLDLSLNHSVPSSLLILSRARLFSLPVDTIGVTSLPFEDSISQRQRNEALAVLASASSLSREREEFLKLVNKELFNIAKFISAPNILLLSSKN
ncbi:mitochondrial proton/calcium exchanger protein-like protein [Tanacetum coccineum]